MPVESAEVPTIEELPKKVRVSLGSAIAIGLLNGRVDAEPTTAYLMTYREAKCTANCGFCPQARQSRGKADMLSRVSWPVFDTKTVINSLQKTVSNGKIRRVCFQALNYPEVFSNLQMLANAIRQQVKAPISVSCQPLTVGNIELLAEAGFERVGIPLDAATEEIFNKIKGAEVGGPYRWKRQLQLLGNAVRVFGKNHVSTHLIAGLGETEKEMVNIIQWCKQEGVLPALFAFTPIAGTAMEKNPQPPVQSYRRIQLARYLIVHRIATQKNMRFDENGCLTDFGVGKRTLTRIIRAGKPFLTSGCTNCNRPFYNEKPSGPIYNYPRELAKKEVEEVQASLDYGWK